MAEPDAAAAAALSSRTWLSRLRADPQVFCLNHENLCFSLLFLIFFACPEQLHLVYLIGIILGLGQAKEVCHQRAVLLGASHLTSLGLTVPCS